MRQDDLFPPLAILATWPRLLLLLGAVALASAGCGDRLRSHLPPPADDVEAPEGPMPSSGAATVGADPKPATGELSGLVGQERDAVARLLGRPHQVETDGVSLVWRYHAGDCNLELVFYPDIKTEQYHALQYALTDSAGNETAEQQPCFNRIQENGRRANS